jgi:hypothetical protein
MAAAEPRRPRLVKPLQDAILPVSCTVCRRDCNFPGHCLSPYATTMPLRPIGISLDAQKGESQFFERGRPTTASRGGCLTTRSSDHCGRSSQENPLSCAANRRNRVGRTSPDCTGFFDGVRLRQFVATTFAESISEIRVSVSSRVRQIVAPRKRRVVVGCPHTVVDSAAGMHSAACGGTSRLSFSHSDQFIAF